LEEAMELADEAGRCLRGPKAGRFLSRLYGNRPDRWSSRLSGPDRWRFLTMAFTRMRYLRDESMLDFSCKQVPSQAPEGLVPWYAVRRRHYEEEGPIVFGHWSTLGAAVQGRLEPYRVYPIDTGCVWGGMLSALRLDILHAPEALIQVPCSRLPEAVR
jgi:bis(5'-nucleosyl)-tetraphosphatase (symmetrical)